MNGIHVRYIYSACIIISTSDVSILCDPWFSEGIYDGSWFHFPRIESPIQSIGNVDYIYISHIHPDHYDSKFLKKYFEVYGVKKIIIANHSPNHLKSKINADGMNCYILKDELKIGSTSIKIIPHITGSISDIDSAIIVKQKSRDERTHCVVNANDIIFDEKFRKFLKSTCGEVDILLCGYTGAGPYPQTYFDLNDPQLILEANAKKLAFFNRYKLLIKEINAKVNIPFAGKYILGGALAPLNYFRGVADPVEILRFDERAIILADDGGLINTENLQAVGVRLHPYPPKDIALRINEVKGEKLDYEKLIDESFIYKLPLKRLLRIAAQNAYKRSECIGDYFFCIRLPDGEYAVINANKAVLLNVLFLKEGEDVLPLPRHEITIDPRYLFGLLTHIYHWNNAEVGSLYRSRRIPNEFNRQAQYFLNYLTV